MWRYLCCCRSRPEQSTPAMQPDQGLEMAAFLPRRTSQTWTPLACDASPAAVSPVTNPGTGRRRRSGPPPPIHMAVQRVLVEVQMQCIRAGYRGEPRSSPHLKSKTSCLSERLSCPADVTIKVDIESKSRFVVTLQSRARGFDHQSRAATIQWLADTGTIILGRAGIASQWDPSVHTDPLEADDDPRAYTVAMRFHEDVAYM